MILHDWGIEIIRFFSEKEDFNYHAPDAILRKYRETVSLMPPDIRRELSSYKGNYEIPVGFLAAVQSLIRDISNHATASPHDWIGLRPSLQYAFHAKPYRLSVRKISYVSNFTAPSSGIVFQNVAEVDFRIKNLKEGHHYDFTLWFSTEGPTQSIPLRIAYQPKWWLRLRLDLYGEQLISNPD